jgi:hypothetical protein
MKQHSARPDAALQAAVNRTEARLADLKKAEAARWTLLQKDVQRAIDDMRGAMPPAAPRAVKPATPAAPAASRH